MKVLVKRIEEFEYNILGYRVDRRKQAENIGMVAAGLGMATAIGLYFEHLPTISALIFRF